ncbi:MAG: response regulator transcription factor [Eubacteriales bacterium]
MKVLIVEDDLHLSEALEHIMKEQGCHVDVVSDGSDGIYYATNTAYDVIILDVTLPKMNGYDVMKTLRMQKIATPTIMLTAKNEVNDQVAGLDAGADDYIVKPFAPKELLARVRAVSRRFGEMVVDELTFGDLVLNINTNTLSCGLKKVSVTHKELQIIEILMSAPSTITSKESLITNVWGVDSDMDKNNMEAYISFLRKKLQYINSKVGIQTIRMTGYRLEENRVC